MYLLSSSSILDIKTINEYTLDNGLTVILHQDNTNPLIVVSMLYHVGSKNNYTCTGLSHCFEHLMFQKTKNIKHGEFFKYVSYNGGKTNAYTNKDFTFFYEMLPSNNLKLALWLESERMRNAIIDLESINAEKKIIQVERSMIYDNKPYLKIISEKLPYLLFKKHPYKYSIIGSSENINNFHNYDYKNFYKTYYVPNNAILTIAGDLNLEKVKYLINTYFETIPKGKTPKFNFIEENSIFKEIVHTYKDEFASIPAVIISYRTNAYQNINLDKNMSSLKDVLLLNFISKLLLNGESSFLRKKLIHNKKIASFINYSIEILENYTILTIYAIGNKNVDLNKLTEVIDEEIENFKKNLSEKDIEKQINFCETNYLINNLSMLYRAQKLAENKFLFGKSNIDIISLYKSFTINDIKQVANKYLQINKRVRLHIKI
ncbi:MAG: insulinase family protein [Candidatus Bostrichicola ureolyticus]|nr:MAG: insulinase family protein [Candidatus Bostrichicola ureolyticus]